MAGLKFRASVLETAIPAGTKITLFQIKAPANQGLLVHEWNVSFKGTGNADDPNIEVVAELQSGDGTGGASLTLVKGNPNDSSSIQSTALQNITTTPGVTSVIHPAQVKPDGDFTWLANFYTKPTYIPPGGRFGVTVKSTQINNADGYADVEE